MTHLTIKVIIATSLILTSAIALKHNSKLMTQHVPNAISSGAISAANQYAVINNKKIAYRVIGKGDPIILCNRFRGILDSWDPAFIDALAKSFRVIIFDYSGIGLSSGTLPASIADVATDVKDLAEFLHLKKIIIGGWSYGGIVAQTFSTHYPELITHTIVIGTNPPGKNENPPEEIFLKTSAKPVNDLDDEIILFFEPSSATSRKAAKLSHDRIAARKSDKDIPVTPDKFGLYFKGVADYALDTFNSRNKLGLLKTPVLSISGDHDCVCPVENWYPLTRRMRNLHIVVLPDAGHGPQHQYIGLTVKYMTDFVRHSMY